MSFRDFQLRLSHFPVFSLQDIRKAVPSFSYRQLDRWEKSGYLRKVRQGFYCFRDWEADQDFLFYAANKIYSPSYISLEIALKWYGIIPEEIFQVTSISTRKTADFSTPIGNFRYRHLKPDLYFGFRLLGDGQRSPVIRDRKRPTILIAELEKALLDYLYLHPRLKTADDFRGMRVNTEELKKKLDERKLNTYLDLFGKKTLRRRVGLFFKTLYHDLP